MNKHSSARIYEGTYRAANMYLVHVMSCLVKTRLFCRETPKKAESIDYEGSMHASAGSGSGLACHQGTAGSMGYLSLLSLLNPLYSGKTCHQQRLAQHQTLLFKAGHHTTLFTLKKFVPMSAQHSPPNTQLTQELVTHMLSSCHALASTSKRQPPEVSVYPLHQDKTKGLSGGAALCTESTSPPTQPAEFISEA